MFNVRMEVVNSTHTLPAKQLANLDSKPGSGAVSWNSDSHTAQSEAGVAGRPSEASVSPDGASRQQHASDILHPGVSFWPLPEELKAAELCVEVRNDC